MLSMRNLRSVGVAVGAVALLVTGLPSAASAGHTGMPSASMCEGKQEWPELVGAQANEAQRVIEEENPNVSVSVMPKGSLATTDHRCDRVRVHTESETDSTVVRAPRVG